MTPEFIDGMSWEMAEVYGAITDQILVNLAHYFKYWKPGQPVPQSSFEYQANMLAQMGQVNRETVRIIRNGLTGADDALKRTLEQAIIESVSKAQPELLEAVKRGILSPAGIPVVAPSQMRAFQLYYQQAANKLNLVNTVMLESTQSAYQQAISDVVAEITLADRMNRVQIAIDTAAGETVTGVSSWNQALKHATDRMKENSIVGFIDHAGRRWSAEAYTAMDIRTTVANTARAATWETNQNFGNDLYQVSYHNGARPLCYPYQNKVISSIDAARTVQDLDGNDIEVIAQSATSYGQPAGLFGINCKHYPTPFIPGVSIIRGEPQDPQANEKTYAESQEQRRLERKLREEKRDLMMAKAQGADPEEIARLREKTRQSSQDIQDFCDSTGRARHRDREAVYTKREFPDKDKYDVAAFDRKQKDVVDQFFSGGGSQQGYTFGQMTPNAPVVPTPAPVVPQNVAQQATTAKPQVDTIAAEPLDASKLPDSFNKRKNKAFADAVNATEGVNPDVVKMFNTMGEQVDAAGYPIKISYTESGHAVTDYVRTFSGERVKIDVKVPKLTDPEYIRQEIGTTAHEWGHLFDHMNSPKGVLSYTFDNQALPNAMKNARPMSERVSKLIADAVSDGRAAEKLVADAAKAEIDAISADISKALSERNYSEYTKLAKKRDSIWKKAQKDASKASRKAHNGMNAVEDIYDAISGGTLRDNTSGLYGHGSRYYKHNPGGQQAATETIANYCSLALAYPELFQMMAEEQPEIWEACGNIINAMIGR